MQALSLPAFLGHSRSAPMLIESRLSVHYNPNPMEQNTPAPDLPDETLVDSLLMRTSRTFALNIPLLPESLRQDVGIAYLLFRAADTIEDGSQVDRRTKRRPVSYTHLRAHETLR